MADIDDGGPAFPVLERGAGGLELTAPGMSQRALFAAILMPRTVGTEVIDQLATNAVQGADALLRALAEPKQPEPRFDYDASAAPTAEKEALKRLASASFFDELPRDTRDFVRHAVHRIDMDENDIPF
jgi:hypothetical protein